MTTEEKIISLLENIIIEIQKNTKETAELKNLFLKYDEDLLVQDESIREG